MASEQTEIRCYIYALHAVTHQVSTYIPEFLTIILAVLINTMIQLLPGLAITLNKTDDDLSKAIEKVWDGLGVFADSAVDKIISGVMRNPGKNYTKMGIVG